MKNSILTLVLCAFLISCQTETQSEDPNTTKAIEKANEPVETQSKNVPSDSVKVDYKNSKIGAIQSGKQSVCLKIQNSKLNVGEEIQIVIPRLPQKLVVAEISEKSACKETNFGDLDEGDITDYLLKSSDRNFLNLGYGIGVVTAQKVQMNGNFATLDLDGDKKPEYFRECTSMEGLHLTVWKGKPFVGAGIWHTYYGLGYDTVPTCTKKDFYGTDD